MEVSRSAKSAIHRHVSPEFPIECVREITRLIRSGEYLSLDMGSHVFTLLAWVFAYAGGTIDPSVFGSAPDGESYAALSDLYEELGGKSDEVDMTYGISDAVIAFLIRRVIEMLIEYLNTKGQDWIAKMVSELMQ